ncbi:rhomboid family intramembrane serine protease [Candidatus Pacearchaeota archaeon]|nr:rhomboid family intramembrane serine protease [Candidatus Pacearchaeota archaeon]
MNYYKIRRKKKFSDRLNRLSVTSWIIIVTAIISILSFVLIKISESYIDYFALKPASILQGKYLWTILTHMFVHGGIAHLLINMFVLFSLGGLSERIIGRKRFLWFYLIAGLFAGILSVLLAGFFGASELGARIFGSPDIYMVGASGAIFAIAGLYVILLPRLKFMIIFLPFFALPAYIMIPLMLVVMWVITILLNAPIGNVAHLGGFLVGIAYGLYLKKRYTKKVKILQRMFR